MHQPGGIRRQIHACMHMREGQPPQRQSRHAAAAIARCVHAWPGALTCRNACCEEAPARPPQCPAPHRWPRGLAAGAQLGAAVWCDCRATAQMEILCSWSRPSALLFGMPGTQAADQHSEHTPRSPPVQCRWVYCSFQSCAAGQVLRKGSAASCALCGRMSARPLQNWSTALTHATCVPALSIDAMRLCRGSTRNVVLDLHRISRTLMRGSPPASTLVKSQEAVHAVSAQAGPWRTRKAHWRICSILR